MARTKYVGPMYLDAELYAQLERQGRSQERDPLQHARWLIKQALQDAPAPKPDACQPSTAPVAQDAA